ncbi:nucleoside triphosphate pyrophosphohydrolase [Halomicroarcula sp. GCM10025709]|uniref:nucleoside triphosphate pyrophosphohydrolase n=1 Tax=Haloarcula TaxID=2237 RepID=UPI0024C39A17|nr:nucleoside triphosphate pyrophosphohydrolase [Halomicroarcula sp. YJ-61-S]
MAREYDKLVRDDIPEIIEADGETPVTHVVEGHEHGDRLAEKLLEEATEYREDGSVAELADVLEVVDALRRYHGVSEDELTEKREQKAEQRGRFENGIVLERVER